MIGHMNRGLVAVTAIGLGTVSYSQGHGGGETLNFVRLDGPDVDPLAVCGDGSAAGYYWKAAPQPSNLWIVDLKGGGWCWDEASCHKRCPPESAWRHLCSSKHYSGTRDIQGLFSPSQDPMLQHANKVFVPYCSSDAHMGDGEAFGMQFRGKRIVQAVLTDLVRLRGLGGGNSSAGPTKDLLIFGGQSAGGRGSMVHLDYVKEMIGTVSDFVDVVGFLDSPLWLDVEPYDMQAGFGKQCQDVYKFANVSHLGSECVEAHPLDSGDTWKCIMGQYRMPHVKTPYLVIASQYDGFQLGENHINQYANASQRAYAGMLANETKTLMRSLKQRWNATHSAADMGQQQNAVLSWACLNHARSLTPAGFDQDSAGSVGTTVHNAFRQFLGWDERVGPAPYLQWIDTCESFACGTHCFEGTSSEFLV